MKNIVDNPMVKFTAGVILLFLAMTMFVEVPILKLWLDAARIAIFAVLWVVLIRTAWTVYWSGAKTGSERLAVALSVLSGTVLLHAVWTPLKENFRRHFPDWMMDGHMGSFIVLLYCLAGIGFLIPIGNTVGVTPPRNYWFLVIAGALGGTLFGLMIGLGIQAPPD